MKKDKNNGLKRLLSFTGNSLWLITLAQILSGISAMFIMAPFLCVFFAAKELVVVFAGETLNSSALVGWGIKAVVAEFIGLLLYFLSIYYIL